MPRRILLSWSSGKDSAWTLHLLKQDPQVEVAGLLTTFNESADRVAMHAVRRELVRRQAQAAGLPLVPVMLPWPCPNEIYEERFGEAVEPARQALDVDAIAFGDLYLEDVRRYRERQLDDSALEALFPIWHKPTAELAVEMIDAGLVAHITCIDPKQCPREFAGRRFDHDLLSELPDGVDPCGENGEFHTFVPAGPMFRETIGVRAGEIVERDGFVFCDLLPDDD